MQLGNSAHRNYWNIRAAHNFWIEKGPAGFNGGRKLGWWYEGEGEGEDEGYSRGGNWITWGIERLEEELEDMLVKERRTLRRRKGKGQTVNVVKVRDREVGKDAEEMSIGSMRDLFTGSPISSACGFAPPASPRSLKSGSDAGSQGNFYPNPETREQLANYLRGKELDGDGDGNIVESIEPNPHSGDNMSGARNRHYDFPKSPPRSRSVNTYKDLETDIHPSLRSHPGSGPPSHKRNISQDSDSDGGLYIRGPGEDTYGRVRKSPKRSPEATATAAVGDAAEKPISISSNSSQTLIEGEEEIIKV